MRFLTCIGAVGCVLASPLSVSNEPISAQGLRQAQSELVLQLEQLRQETQALRGLIEELSFQVETMSQDQRQRYLDLDDRLGDLVRIQREGLVSSQPLMESTDSDSAPSAAQTEETITDQEAYSAAFQLIRERKFDEALDEMARFVESYPSSPLVLDACFWRGQVYDVQGEDTAAIEEFEQLVALAPDYRRILQVKVKLGSLLVANQDLSRGRLLLQEVIDQAPDSIEAGLAQRELDALN